MQQLAKETNSQVSTLDSSEQLMELVPVIMRRIRYEMRQRTMAGLSIVQFRALNFIRKHPDTSLKDVAEHLGLTPPSTSKLIQKLVVNMIIERKDAPDRRRVCLSLTRNGVKALAAARAGTRQQLANSLRSLSQDELVDVSKALHILSGVFSQGGGDVDVP
jgi:DNA-binding MarR family transcriptional regulator